ncbi:arsenic metallochaperone ArsD family protein [Erysipelothrix aquatica]|uniref:arsenic metallochaperone ArsD family protein n=1 Tax=Erysipelothrix aquatica TaxID=2683714 RepID=UPI00135B63C7|nr:arsenic metallochaperone ArsD family protein [Erysipelothrix aquatica]
MELKIYESSVDLATSLLGISTDVRRENFDKLIDMLQDSEINIQRINDPQASNQFNLLLPVLVVDGEIVHSGAYPKAKELSAILKIDESIFDGIVEKSELFTAANTGRIGVCCGVGTDVYLDPYDDDMEDF